MTSFASGPRSARTRVAPNEQLVLTMLVSNVSPTTLLQDVALNLRIPPGLEAFSRTLTNAAGVTIVGCQQVITSVQCNADETMVLDIGDLPSGASRRVDLIIPIAADTQPGQIVPLYAYTSRMSMPAPRAIAQALTVGDAQGPGQLDVDITATPSPTEPAGSLRYDIDYGNRGQSTADDVTVVLALPEGASLVSASDGGMSIDGMVSWPVGTVGAGDTAGVRAIISNGTDVEGTLYVANVEVQDASGSEPDDRAEVASVVGTANLGLEVSLESSPVAPEDGLYYTATVGNLTETTLLTDVKIELRLPPGLDDTSRALVNAPGGAVIGCQQVITSVLCNGNETLIVEFGDLQAGATRTLRGPLNVAATTPQGTLLRMAFAAIHAGQAAPITRTKTLSVQAPEGGSDLRLFVSPSANPVSSDDELSYVLTFGNRGLNPADNVSLSFALPEGAGFVSASESGSEQNGIVSWSIGRVGPGEGGRRFVTVRDAASNSGRILQADAEIAVAGAPRPADESSASVPVGDTLIDLDVMLDTDSAEPGETITFTASVSNTSTTALLQNLRLNLRIPDGLDSFSAKLGQCPRWYGDGMPAGCDFHSMRWRRNGCD